MGNLFKIAFKWLGDKAAGLLLNAAVTTQIVKHDDDKKAECYTALPDGRMQKTSGECSPSMTPLPVIPIANTVISASPQEQPPATCKLEMEVGKVGTSGYRKMKIEGTDCTKLGQMALTTALGPQVAMKLSPQ